MLNAYDHRSYNFSKLTSRDRVYVTFKDNNKSKIIDNKNIKSKIDRKNNIVTS